MIEFNDDNDPMLFAMTLPAGRLVVQYMEVLATAQAGMVNGAEPNIQQIAEAIRTATRTPEVARVSTDAHLIAAWHRMTLAVQKSGNA